MNEPFPGYKIWLRDAEQILQRLVQRLEDERCDRELDAADSMFEERQFRHLLSTADVQWLAVLKISVQ
jgi:hypothetical protein